MFALVPARRVWRDACHLGPVLDVPHVGDPKLFEMPVRGFFGHLPFGVLCWTWWLHHAALLRFDLSIDVVPGLGPTTLVER